MAKRGRVFLMFGFLLAIVVAIGVVVVTASPQTAPTAPAKAKVVVAAVDLVLGTPIRAEQVKLVEGSSETAPSGAFTNTADVVGLVIRRNVSAGGMINAGDFVAGGVANGSDIVRALPAGFTAIAVQVDQVSGVGTLIQPGDHVNVILTLPGSAFPSEIRDPLSPTGYRAIANVNATSVKLLVQDVAVIGTLLPPPAASAPVAPAATRGPSGSTTAPSAGVTGLNGQTQIVILAVTASQSEVIRYGQSEGQISLALRSAIDNGTAALKTDGATLKMLVDKYGVLSPQVIITTHP